MNYSLGIDMGTNSVGWGIVNIETGEPVRAGVCVFETSVEGGDIEQGKEETKNKARRDARMSRRMRKHREMRMRSLFQHLRNNGLLPSEIWRGKTDSEARHAVMGDMEKRMKIALKEKDELDSRTAQLVSYYFRAKALEEKLPLHFTGACIYHIANRRGFKSNRKSDKKDKEIGVVKEGIKNLYEFMSNNNARTIGEYFSKCDPETEKIRGQWTGREMFESELNLLWAKQAEFYPDVLTEELKAKIHRAIFNQRPIKFRASSIGYCTFEHYVKRAPLSLPDVQEFRLLQHVNNLKLVDEYGKAEFINEEMKDFILSKLSTQKELGYSVIYKKFNIPDSKHFNFEKSEKDKIKGSPTNSEMIKVFGKEWLSYDDVTQNNIVRMLLNAENDEEIISKATKEFGLNRPQAEALTKVSLESGYASLSHKAIKKLLPLMRNGLTYSESVKEIYGDITLKKFDKLPNLYDKQLPNEIRNLKNPIVFKTLSELRRIVNAITAEYGKPSRIVVELARDMKKSKSQRENIFKENKRREKERDNAKINIQNIAEAGISNPSGVDIEKYRLWEECDGICPYTLKSISLSELFTPKWEIEHIIPFSRSLDNSFNNKTLCYSGENRNKNNRTPFEAYSGSKERWDELVIRAKNVWHKKNRRKFYLFITDNTEFLSGFSERQLNDTRYASKLAAKYLGLLYGGINDADKKKRVYATSGGITSFLRNAWDLNKILADGPGKNRDDHRHHAVDAMAIAYTDAGIVKKLQEAASRKFQRQGKALFENMEAPYDGFYQKCCDIITNINVVHRASKKVNKKIHNETHYGRPRTKPDGKTYVPIRKKLDNTFDRKKAEKIEDPVIKQIVMQHLEQHNNDPKKAFTGTDMPFMTAKDGRKIPIKKVRIWEVENPAKIGSGERYILPGSNHHVEIIERINDKGESIWDGVVVSTLTAMERLKSIKTGEPINIINRSHDNAKFLFSLSIGEIFKMKDKEGTDKLYRVDGITQQTKGSVTIKYRLINDARKAEYGVSQFAVTPNAMKIRFISKHFITPLGEIRTAND